MPPPDPQPARWTREIAAAPRSEGACSASSIRLTTGAAIGFTAGAVASLIAAGASGRPELIFVAIILVPAAGAFWYITARDRGRRETALARDRDLVKSLTDIETRLGAGAGTEARRSALADLAEWISLRSRLDGAIFNLDAWRRFTNGHGTPMVVMLGLDAPPRGQLAPTYEEIDLEQESPGLSRRRMLRLALLGVWSGLVAWQSPAILQLAFLTFFLGAVAWEFGFNPANVRSAVVSPGRIEVSELRRTRAAEAGTDLAVIERRSPGGFSRPPVTMLTLLGPSPAPVFAFRHESDTRIPLFLASWLTPRADPGATGPDAVEPAGSRAAPAAPAFTSGRSA